GSYRYASPQGAPPPRAAVQRNATTLQSFVTGMDVAAAILVVKTLPGRASAVASAIDEVKLEEICATLAGDDTVLVLVRRDEDRDRVRRALEGLI
ncbi:MAG: arginine repressor, partial [Candidatus Eremiobacterota bacterium]